MTCRPVGGGAAPVHYSNTQILYARTPHTASDAETRIRLFAPLHHYCNGLILQRQPAIQPSGQIAPWPGSRDWSQRCPALVCASSAHPASAIFKYDSAAGDDLLLAKRKGHCQPAT